MPETCPHDGLFAAATPDLVRCPYPVYEHLRSEHPVEWIPALTAFAVTRHADILDVLRRPEDWSSTRQSGPGAATTLARAAAEDPAYPDRVRAAAVPGSASRRRVRPWSTAIRRGMTSSAR